MTHEPDLVTETRGAVRVLRLNRPEARNALNGALMDQLAFAFDAAEADPEVGCVVLTGTGDRAFCSGMDLAAFAAGDASARPSPEAMASFRRLLDGGVDIPVVAAVNATAVAGGFELLLGCDLVVASAAARFGLPEVKRGLFPGGPGAFLSTRIPLAIALELTLTGDPVDAARAAELGLVNRVVAPEDVLEVALALAGRIAANGPLAVKATKQVVRRAADDMAEARALQADWQPVVFGSEDAQEGATAFVERRDPIWKGR